MLRTSLSRLTPRAWMPALFVLAAMPAWAHDLQPSHYDRDQHRAYDHYQRDRHEDSRHRVRDRVGGFGHAVGDLFRYGTTNPNSSPDHYYRDQHRAYDHYQRDRRRDYDHYRRDRHEADDHYFEDAYGPYGHR